jgi:hypothetical protein
MPGGTRFRLFPQFAEGYREPEVVEIALAPGMIGPGPQDNLMYVANAVDKPLPYQVPDRRPPYKGPLYPPAMPGPDGHFDRIPMRTPQFLAAHIYGGTRRVLDLWQDLLGQPIVWWHADAFPQLELVPKLRWGNAHSGPGFLETGLLWTHNGVPQELALNFDVVAHETGHIILYSILGAPAPGRLTGAFLAFHETFADHVAAISALYFKSVVARLLLQTRGNLYALNLISRLGELSGNEQVRVLDNDVRLSDLGGLRLGPDGTWIDPLGLGRRQHAASAPLSGAIWDCLVDLYQDGLVTRGAIAPQIDTRGWTPAEVSAALSTLSGAFGVSWERFADGFFAAIRAARDLIGLSLARSIQRLDPNDLDFATVAARFCEAAVELGQGHVLPAFVENFLYRGIDPRPLLRRAVIARGARPATERLRHDAATRRFRTFGHTAPFGDARLGRRDTNAIATICRLIDHPHRGAAALAGT